MPRTLADEQQVVTEAVISVLHALVEIANNDELPSEIRIDAAWQVLEYAKVSDAPTDDKESVEEESEGESDATES